jgi:S1-C subfamily serine protease
MRRPSKLTACEGVDNPLVAGDVIHAINGVAVSDLNSLSSALTLLKPGSFVALQVEREGILTSGKKVFNFKRGKK